MEVAREVVSAHTPPPPTRTIAFPLVVHSTIPFINNNATLPHCFFFVCV